jgi:DNA-binding response OmpR family regulator
LKNRNVFFRVPGKKGDAMKKRILICDDDADTREVVALILKKHGFETGVLENTNLVIEQALAFSPHLITLDILMPGIAGKDARRLLREHAETKDIPVLVLSALSNGEQLAQEIGAEGFLAKPFDIKVLIEKIKRMTEGSL